MIAVGIFLTPAQMAKSIGAPLPAFLVWLAMGTMAVAGALCYGELASRFPEAGGGYVYLREAYGPRVAFLYGWKCFLVLDPGLTAALAVGISGYVAYMFSVSDWQQKVIAVGTIAAVAAANVAGLRFGAGLLRWLTVFKVALLSVIIVWAFGGKLGDWSNFVPFAMPRSGLPVSAVAGAVLSGFFSFGGWWDLTKMAGEVRDPSRVLPRAIAYGVCAVTAIYIATSAAFFYLVPLERVASGETFAAQAGEALFGAFGGKAFAAIVVISVLGSLVAIMMAAPRVYFAMAGDGLFLKSAASVHPRFGTPARAILLQAALAVLLVVIGTFQQIVAYFIFITVVFIGLTVASLFVLRRRGASVVFRTPGYPLTPILFLALVVGLLALLAFNNPTQALLGAAVVLLGLPAYRLIKC